MKAKAAKARNKIKGVIMKRKVTHRKSPGKKTSEENRPEKLAENVANATAHLIKENRRVRGRKNQTKILETTRNVETWHLLTVRAFNAKSRQGKGRCSSGRMAKV